MCSFKSIYFVIFVLNLYKTNAQISDKRLCVDQDCNEPVSLAKTLLRYSSPDPRILSFAPNQDIKIFSKEAGSETNLWGAEIKGKRGYVPKHLVREYKVFNKPKLLVDTELKQKPQVPVDLDKENIDPNKAQQPFEVVDGTTIYLGPQDSINPTSTESPILATAVPPGSNEAADKIEDLKTVSDSKEKIVAVKEKKEESVVNNVLSKLSNWISDDTNSEENGDAEDEEDDEDDDEIEEDEEEEASMEDSEYIAGSQDKLQHGVKNLNVEKTDDLNTLHDLPPGVKTSPYSLEVDQSMQSKVPLTQEEIGGSSLPSSSEIIANNSEEIIKENDALQENTASKQETTVDSSTVHSMSETNAKGTTMSEHKADLKPETEQAPSLLGIAVKESAVSERGLENVKKSSEPITTVDDLSSTPKETQETKVEDSSIPVAATEEPVALDKTLELNIPPAVVGVESQSKSSSGPVADQPEIKEEINDTDKSVAETVTEPTFSDELSMPFVDEVTPDPLEGKAKGEEATEQTPNVEPPLGEVEGSRNQEVQSFPPPTISNDIKPQDTSTENLTENLQVQTQTVPEILSPPSNIDITVFPTSAEHSQDFEQNPIGDEEQSSAQSSSSPSFVDSVLNQDHNLENERVNKQNDNSKEDVSDQMNYPKGEKIESELSEQNFGFLEEKETPNNDQQENLTVSRDGNINNDSKEKNEVTSEDDFEIDDEVEEQQTQHTNEETLSNEIKDSIKNSEEVSDNTKESGGIFSDLLSIFGNSVVGFKPESNAASPNDDSTDKTAILEDNAISSQDNKEAVIGYCDASQETCNTSEQKGFINQKGLLEDVVLNFNSDIFLYLLTTSVSVIVFLFGYMAFDRNRREAPLVARINKLEKELLITLKENELLQEKGSAVVIQEVDTISSDVVEELTQRLTQMQVANQELENRIAELVKELDVKDVLEEQIESLEKELETSTEVGMELNRIISEMLDPTNGSDRLKENVEQLQRQLLEQKDTINTINLTLNEKESENQMLQANLERSKKKVVELQTKLDEIVDRILKIEKEKDEQHNTLQHEIAVYQQKFSQAANKEEILNNEIQILKMQLAEAQRQSEIKGKEYQMLQENLNKIKLIRNDSNSLKSLLDATSAKAELQQFKVENQRYTEQLQQEQSLKVAFEKKYQAILVEINLIQQKYEQADKEKVEASSKLDVLNSYFKKREAELQEELIKYKSIWEVKEGEATSTTERIKHMQEEIENYKAQNETLKQEIMSQEIDLKSQISVLEKKVHENWVTARQMERKLEDARQEAAQLRNRLTLRERIINEERAQNRLQSPVEQNGELPLSPHPIDSPASPPLLYGGRDHITKSPPIPGLPPFLPPPPGAPFMPPSMHGMPPFMPPPPSMFPGDHRPPPLGRMSSPPLNSRYSPDTSGFSPYDRHSPSPPYDSEYGTSPPPMRGYSPYNNRDDRRDYKRPPHVRNNGRNMKGSVMSSGSDHSNDSLDKINRKPSKLV